MTTWTHLDFQRAANESRRNLRRLKKTAPYVFPEYARLEGAKRALANAEQELAAAQAAWDSLAASDQTVKATS